jgi:hypothetical protein
MVRELDRLDPGVRRGRPDDDPGPLERLDVPGVEPVAAPVEALERLQSADLRKPRPGTGVTVRTSP